MAAFRRKPARAARRAPRGRLVLVASICCALTGLGRAGATPAPATLAFEGGAVHVMDAGRTVAQALAVRGERIVYAGSAKGLKRFIGPHTRVVDLLGGALFPGFTDAHVHPALGGRVLATLNVARAQSPAELQRQVAAYAQAHPALKVITGGGWSRDIFPGGTPDKALLDQAAPDRPVVLSSDDVHSTWVNSAVLAAAGIVRDTPDPPAGRIEHDARTGEPTGVLRERAGELVAHLAPPPSLSDKTAALRAGLAYENASGYVAVVDAAVPTGWEDAYLVLERDHGLTARAALCLVPGDQLMQTSVTAAQIAPTVAGLQRRRAAIAKASAGGVSGACVKIFADGVIEDRTAALLDPYKGVPQGRDYRGELRMAPAVMAAYVTALDKAAFQVHFHAIGDRAARVSLDAIQAAESANGPRDRRDVIAHLQVLEPQDEGRFKALGVYADIQPLWASMDDDMVTLTLPFLSVRAAKRQYAFQSLHAAGATLVIGSDWSVSSSDPMHELHIAVNRREPGSGRAPLLLEQALDVDTVMAGLTVHGAELMRQEDRRGTLIQGRLADLTLLSADPYRSPKADLSAIAIRMTVVGGRIVYDAPGPISVTKAAGRLDPGAGGRP